MVATTFAADTPLAVTELVARNGIAGNWLWWSAAIGGMLTVFFFARLWRRSGVLTDVEFIELRYSGRAAAWPHTRRNRRSSVWRARAQPASSRPLGRVARCTCATLALAIGTASKVSKTC